MEGLQKDAQVLLSVPSCLVKSTKDALQRHQRLEKSAKIRGFCATEAFMYLPSNQDTKSSEENYLIPTTVRASPDDDEKKKLMLKAALLDMIDFNQHTNFIGIYLRNVSTPGSSLPIYKLSQPTSILGQMIQKWLLTLPPAILPLPISDLVSISTWPYTIYHPLLLLPQNTFSNHPWPDLLSTTLRSHIEALYILLCTHLKITHIALNAPIPTQIPGTPNILRKPEDLVPLHGSFGPSLSPTHIPSSIDFQAAFWCTVRQNGIFQTWAPRHTMFSRGNISEKTRLIGLKTLTTEGLGGIPASATSAVDLYAGIGYFAFCYAKLGVSKILCWELSGWSVEGLRRGSTENGWGVEAFNFNAAKETLDNETVKAKLAAAHNARNAHNKQNRQIIIFQEDNQNAPDRLHALRSSIPPIRHVNCGFLPTSQASWETAIRALDPRLGGWIHVHENIERNAFEQRKEEIVREFRELARRWWWWRPPGEGRDRSPRRNREQSEEEEEEEEKEHTVLVDVDVDVDDTPQSRVSVNESEPEPEPEPEPTTPSTGEKAAAAAAAVKEHQDHDDKMTTTIMTSVECVHFEQVKSYAPGIMHCVLDIAILPYLTT